MNEITLIFPYYENPGMLVKQREHIAALPQIIRENLRVIFVDDGSPDHPVTDEELGLWKGTGLSAFAAYRMLIDVRWNWIACRNLAVSRAKTEWVLMTDIDHLLPIQTARRVMNYVLDKRRVYRFSRVDAPDMTPYKPHPNSWLMTRRMFDRIGGYDERFSGFYGTDGEFRDRVTAQAGPPIMLDEPLVRVPREVQADASTTRYGRKEVQDHENVPRIREVRNSQPGWKTLRDTFPWERIA